MSATRPKNPLAILLGSLLQQLRNDKGYHADHVASAIGITSGAYRLIESGSANLNVSRLPELLALEPFETLRYDKMARLLAGVQILDPYRSEGDLFERVETLATLDIELRPVLDEVLHDDLLHRPKDLKVALGSEGVLSKLKLYLSQESVGGVDVLLEQLREVWDQAPCLQAPVMRVTKDVVEEQLLRVKAGGALVRRLENLAKDIRALRSAKVGLIGAESPRWFEGMRFEEFVAVTHQHENFRASDNAESKEIAGSFADAQYRQIWRSDFKRFYLLFVTDNVSAAEESYCSFLDFLKRWREGQVLPADDVPTPDGLNRIRAYRVPRDHSAVRYLGLDNEDHEFWYHKSTGGEEGYEFAFEAFPAHSFSGRTDSEEISENPVDHPYHFEALSIKEATDKRKIVEDLLKDDALVRLSCSPSS